MSDRPPDPDSLRYARYWEPVLADPARRLLDRIGGQPAVYLDVGAGAGSLVLAAAQRWPAARIIGLDASAGMLSVARSRVADVLADDGQRFTWLAADAAAMPVDDASVDVATSSFVLQLVADRPAVLAEMRRVLRPGGVLGLVTWLAADLVLAADDAFHDVVAELGLDDQDPGFRTSRTTDYATLGQVRDDLASVGFVDLDIQPDELRCSWTREGYLEFKEHYDERDIFESLDEHERDRLRAVLHTRLAVLPDTAFEVSGPLVWALARAPLDQGGPA